MGKNKNITAESIQEEAREGYSLFERLAESARRTKTVTIYTDDTLGAELGYAIDGTDFGIKTGQRVRKGLIGELDELKERAKLVVAHGTDEEVAAAEVEIASAKKAVVAKIKKVQKAMKTDSLVFTLQSIPEIVIKDARRKARQALNIKSKGIPESKQEEYEDEYTFHALAASVTSWEDKKAGKSFASLSVSEARALKEGLPRGQFPLLDAAMVELSFEAQIHNAAVDDVDF